MATWKDWFKVAKEKNIPLEKYLIIDQPKDLERLHNSGLPFYDFIIVEGKKFQEDNQKIKDFAQKHKQMWIRVLGNGGRYYKLDLRSYEEIIEFITSLKINMEQFHVQLFEYHENKFGGNVIANNDGVYIEIARGTQESVSKHFLDGLIIYKGKINKLGRLAFFEKEVAQDIKLIARRILRLIKLSRTNYLNGYFEFAISPEGKIFFLDYKTSIN